MDDYGLGRLLGYIQDKSYIGSGDAPYSGSLSRQENPIPEKGYEPVQGFVPGLADIAGAWASGSDLGMFYDMMGLQPVDGSPNLVKDLSVTLNIDPESIQKTLNDALAAAGLDQQGNPIKEEVVDLNADTTASDLLSTIDPSLASVAANTGPFVADPAAGADTLVAGGDSDTVADDKETGVSSETAEQILAKYKDRADPVTDMLGDYKQEDGSIFPVNVLLEIISDYAINRNNKDAQIVLGKWNDKVAARKDDILDADAAANNQAAAEAAAARNQAGADAAAQQTSDGNTDTGLKADNAAGGAAGGAGAAGNVPAAGGVLGSADTTVGGAGHDTLTGGAGNDTLSGGGGNDTINNDNDKDKDKDISVISGDSVLDQTGTGNVNVDDKPAGLLNIPTSVPKQPEKKAGMIIDIAQSTPIVETVLDDYLYPPIFRELNNVKQSPFATALLFSNGLMGSFV